MPECGARYAGEQGSYGPCVRPGDHLPDRPHVDEHGHSWRLYDDGAGRVVDDRPGNRAADDPNREVLTRTR